MEPANWLHNARFSPEASGGGADAPSGDLASADEQLVSRAKQGDQVALGQLLCKHLPRIYNHCKRIVRDPLLAEDLANDTVVKLIEGLPRFDGRAQFSTWMTTILLNVCRSHLRKEKVRRHSSLDAPSSFGKGSQDGTSFGANLPGQSELDPALRIRTDEDQRRLRDALDHLTEEQRELILLADFHEHSYEQIGALLHIAVGTVKSRLFRARQALADGFERPFNAASEGGSSLELAGGDGGGMGALEADVKPGAKPDLKLGVTPVRGRRSAADM